MEKNINRTQKKISHKNQIERIQNSMYSKLDIIWEHISNINYKLRNVTRNLRNISKSAASIQTQHLVERTSVLNIRNKSSSTQTIINIQKIEQVIKMWRTIKYVMVNKQNTSLKTINIPVDGTVKWSNIKKDKSLQLKKIDDEDQIEKMVADGISNHPIQAEGTPLTI